ncbi:uncharacterized protein EV154DRAFT_491686 [Mucor mucedo]|uniref:uncharacterized protein n=1 Tax=Mucor mucedo TaxID=29922 RepID=UPI00221FB2D8|nr:uncharacterized protein EV154DRAFT_491686 [Mucor mucedo]KAI7896635.1 hypothetical protein EV154DRAFT_491686 [Mucor mucedo]
MYKVSLNNRIPLNRPVIAARRPLSTNVRKGGVSKALVGGLLLSAAGMAYYQSQQKHDFYGDSDPYAKTKKSLSNATDRIVHDDNVKEKSSGAVDELGYAGQHIKNSAELAADAARNTLSTAEREAQSTASKLKSEAQSVTSNLKSEAQNLKSSALSEAERLREKAYLKEGDRSPEDVVSHATTTSTTRHVDATLNKKAEDANQAAFNAANKFKQAKEAVTHEIEQDVNKVSGFFKSSSSSSEDTRHNPMVHEKISSDKTKPDWESRFENQANQKLKDTSKLVEKDTEKVKQVWDDGTSNAKASLYNVESDVKSAVEEKANAAKETASSVKSSLFNLFGAAEDTVKDTVKDTSHKLSSAAAHANATANTTDRTPWEDRLAAENAVPGQTDQDIVNATKPPAPGKKGTSFDYYHHAEKEGNPMVMEKHSAEKTKPLWESSLEDHAKEVVRDTSTLVDKDTEKVKQGVWDAKSIANEKAAASAHRQENNGFWASLFGSSEKKVANQVEDHAEEAKHKWEGLKSQAKDAAVTKDDVKETASQTWQDAKAKASHEATRAKNNVNSTINDLSNKSNAEANRLETGWNNLKNDANYEAEQARNKAENVATKAKNETGRVASDVTNTAKDIKDEGARLTRQASNKIAGSLDEASAQAESLKYKAEDTAKSWYQKGTEQVKSSINTVKNVADQDINWVEEKIEGAKDEVDRLLGFKDPRQTGLEGHVRRGEKFAEDEAGQLRATRDNVGLKPAEVVVEEAHSKDL